MPSKAWLDKKTPEEREAYREERRLSRRIARLSPAQRAKDRADSARRRRNGNTPGRGKADDKWAARRRGDGLGKIYFLQTASGPIKIGFTKKSAFGRREEVQTGNHEELTILGWYHDTRENEKLLHDKFLVHHIRGEWFHPAPELLELIKTKCTV